MNTEKMPDRNAVKRMLVLYEEKIYNIGDCCVRFDKLKHFASYFSNATVDINFKKGENDKFIDALLKNNPHLSAITTADWKEIDFGQYDVVIAISYNEPKLQQFMQENYGPADKLPFALISLSELILNPCDTAKYIFPVVQSLVDHVRVPGPGELYISEEEQAWADGWLESKGVKKGEQLFIVLDSTLRREKLLNLDVYFEFLATLLKKQNCKVLVFDENELGKEEFYGAWLGGKAMEKMIFSKKMQLRQDLCLLGSSYTRLVVGPCTGLLHCASAIYNRYVNEGMPVDEIPVLMVYTGVYLGPELNANNWWRNSPLVDCLMLKKKAGTKQLTLLANLTEQEKELNDSLPCSEYTAQMLMNFVNSKLKPTQLSVAC
jgi:hypothetical protein